jgi:hypothetical protein
LIGLAPIWGLIGFTLGAGIGMGMLGERITGRDVAIGVVLTLALGFGLLFLHYYTSFATQATAILFGNVLAVDRSTIAILAGLALVTLVALAAIMRPLVFATLQPELAEAKSVPLRFVSTAFLAVVALAVSECAQIVGGDRTGRHYWTVDRPYPFCRPRPWRSLARHHPGVLHGLAGELLHRSPKRSRLFRFHRNFAMA